METAQRWPGWGHWGGTALESGTESPEWRSVSRIDVLDCEITLQGSRRR